MNRRQFLKRIGATCTAAIAVPVALVAAKGKFTIERKWNDDIPFNTSITGFKNIADKALIIYTKDEVWMLEGDPMISGVLTKIGFPINVDINE